MRRKFQILIILTVVAAAPVLNLVVRADEAPEVIKLGRTEVVLLAADPEGQARAAVARGDFRLIWVESVGVEPFLVHCSVRAFFNRSSVLGTVYVSDVPSDQSSREAFRFAKRYNLSLVENPGYPHRDVCRPAQSPDENFLPRPLVYEDVRPAEKRTSDQVQSLVVAARLGMTERARQLAAADADLNARDSFGLSALGWAVARDRRDIVDLLLNAGASVWPPVEQQVKWDLDALNPLNLPAAEQTDPIFIAAIRNDEIVIQHLVAAHLREVAGAGLSARQQSVLNRALEVSQHKPNAVAVDLLEKAGAQTPAMPSDNGSP